jgi:hypothetical protein
MIHHQLMVEVVDYDCTSNLAVLYARRWIVNILAEFNIRWLRVIVREEPWTRLI